MQLRTGGAHAQVVECRWDRMLITYRRTGGALAAVAVAATMLIAAVVVGATLLVVSLVAAAVLLVRAVLPRAWRHRIVPQAASWPHETLEATVVETPGSSRERHLVRTNTDTRACTE